jgi:hypothetical protein
MSTPIKIKLVRSDDVDIFLQSCSLSEFSETLQLSSMADIEAVDPGFLQLAGMDHHQIGIFFKARRDLRSNVCMTSPLKPYDLKLSSKCIESQRIEESSEDIVAAAIEGNLAELQMLLKQDRSLVNCVGMDNQTTPLMFAAKNGNRHCIEALLKQGAEINKHICDPSLCIHKWTAFHFAVDSGQLNCVMSLIDANCDTHNPREIGEPERHWENPRVPDKMAQLLRTVQSEQEQCAARQRLAFARGMSVCESLVYFLSDDLVEQCLRNIEHRRAPRRVVVRAEVEQSRRYVPPVDEQHPMRFEPVSLENVHQLKLSELHQRATELGLAKSLLDAALDDVEPRQSLVTVLRSHNSNVSF